MMTLAQVQTNAVIPLFVAMLAPHSGRVQEWKTHAGR